MKTAYETIQDLLAASGATGEITLSQPPKPEMGDFAYSCFALSTQRGQEPVEVASELAESIMKQKSSLLERVTAFGPYVNFFLSAEKLAANVQERGVVLFMGAAKKNGNTVMVEFAHPSTHKAFHIGHLRNIITGESLVRIFEHVGFSVVRANYQGDVGLHIAKCLYGITRESGYEKIISALETKNPGERAEYLGRAYALGAKAYEESEEGKAMIQELNQKIYTGDKKLKELYSTTRQWSLDYFQKNIYARLGTHFDRLYFESEVFERGVEIVREFEKQGVFTLSEGAVIFEGSKYGLHERVFLNSKGLPTYEAKELALGEKQFGEFHPAMIYHVVGKEQSEYFKVVIKALEFTLPESKGKEEHIVYGWVRLKEGKMSSRSGNVILAEWLLDEVKKGVEEQMKESDITNKAAVAETVAIAATKYAFLRTGVNNDIAFDFKTSVATSGDSGVYLLYMCARIKSILKKEALRAAWQVSEKVTSEEKALLVHLDQFQKVVRLAAENQDPSQVAHYLFDLAQKFTSFYENCPVLKAEGEVKDFRLWLLSSVLAVSERGLNLLGIESVEEM